MYSSSGESILSIRHLAYVTLKTSEWSKITIIYILKLIMLRISCLSIIHLFSEWHMPDVLIQLILLMMSTWLLETCRVSK